MTSISRDHTTAASPATFPETKIMNRKRKKKNILDLTIQNSSNETSTNMSQNKSEKFNIQENVTLSTLQFRAGLLPPVEQKLNTTNMATVCRIPRQRPQNYILPKLNCSNMNRSVHIVRQELLQDKILTQELARRIAEAKLSLARLDSFKDEHANGSLDKTDHESSLVDIPSRVSFLSVSRRVANIIRFRQATLHKKRSGTVSDKEPTIAAEKLPKTPRFSSYMSPAAQYALMKGYEDIIFEKLSSRYPECADMLKRNKTPHHSIAIADRTKSGSIQLNSAKNQYNNEECPKNQEKTSVNEEIRTDLEAELNLSTSKSNGSNKFVLSELKALPNISKGHNSENIDGSLTSQTSSESSRNEVVPPSYTPSINRIASFLTPPTTDKDKIGILPLYGLRGTPSQNIEKISKKITRDALRRDRRILLSYRMEHAMDILDTMNTKPGNYLSPRITIHSRRQITPLAEFNRWTDQWAKEFNPDAVK